VQERIDLVNDILQIWAWPKSRSFRHRVEWFRQSPRELSFDVLWDVVFLPAGAPAAIGPYSQAIQANGLLFLSGCIPLDPASMEVVPGGIKEQVEQVMKNLKAVVEAGGSSMGKVVKTTVSGGIRVCSRTRLTLVLHRSPMRRFF